MTEMTPDEQQRAEELLAELRKRGYVDVAEHEKLRPGTRVRHWGQRWNAALADGTGNVLAIAEKPNSSWSRTYGMPDIEMVVLFDEPGLGGSRLSQLAQYHVAVVEGGAP